MKWEQKHRNIITEIISMLFVVLFVYAAMGKLLDGNKFYNNLNNSPLFGVGHIAGIVSWAIPVIEIGVALLLTFQKTRLKGLYGALILMATFTIYVAGILFISPYTPCSCGGIITLLSWEQHFIFNIIWIGLAITGIVLYRKECGATPHSTYHYTKYPF
ncbi:MauE/DoxX family redox-associated membrane protein [Tamlana crocina]